MIPSILVATDGKPHALGALRMAQLLAERDASRVEVLAVYAPHLQFYGLEGEGNALQSPPPFGPEAVEALQREVRAQLADVGGHAEGWPLSVRLGGTAPMIAQFAAECDAALILVGLRPHAAVERWLGRETPLRLLHLSHVPVLAVPAEARGLPRRAIAAVDLSEFSLRAARAVVELLAPGGELHLVYASWAPAAAESWATMDWVKTYRAAVEERVEQLASELRRGAPLTVHVRIPESSDPAGTILRLADEIGAELIGAGSHGHGFFGRLLLGSVSGRLLHGAHCAVLIAPPTGIPSELRAHHGEHGVVASFITPPGME